MRTEDRRSTWESLPSLINQAWCWPLAWPRGWPAMYVAMQFIERLHTRSLDLAPHLQAMSPEERREVRRIASEAVARAAANAYESCAYTPEEQAALCLVGAMRPEGWVLSVLPPLPCELPPQRSKQQQKMAHPRGRAVRRARAQSGLK